ncbi:MAG TPA: histidine kinase [Rugosimonospora sp.]
MGDTGGMLGKVNWLARGAGFAWLGVLAFAIFPPHGSLAATVQIAGYCLLGVSLVAWSLLEAGPVKTRYRAWSPLTLGVMAVAAGFASGAGNGGVAMTSFAGVAALIAGGDLGLSGGLAVAGAGILAIEISGLIFNASYTTFLALPVFVIAGLVIGRNRGAYRVRAEQAARLLAQHEQLQAEQRRADLLDERARIAREIHDVLAHSLGALGIQIQAARAVLTDHADITKAGELLITAQQLAAQGLVETRQAVYALRTDPPPLNEELAQVSDTHARRYQVVVDFDATGTPATLAPEASLAVLRIAQEALVNAAKHAAGQRVEVRLDYGDAAVRLIVRNHLAPDAGSLATVSTVNGGYGLTGMRERLGLLNGTLRAGRHDDLWVITAELPRALPTLR